MLGALGTKLLTTIQQAVCCLAKRGESCEAPVFVQNCTDAADPGAGAAISLRQAVTNPTVLSASPPGEYTSYEVENLHPTYWLFVGSLITAGNPGGASFLIPPGGSKVVAFSNGAISETPTNFTFFATAADYYADVPVNAGAFDGSEVFQTTLISAG